MTTKQNKNTQEWAKYSSKHSNPITCWMIVILITPTYFRPCFSMSKMYFDDPFVCHPKGIWITLKQWYIFFKSKYLVSVGHRKAIQSCREFSISHALTPSGGYTQWHPQPVLFPSLLPSSFSPYFLYPNSLEKEDLSWEALFAGVSFLKWTSSQESYKGGTARIPTTSWDMHHKGAKPRPELTQVDLRAHACSHTCFLDRAELSIWVCSSRIMDRPPWNIYT